MVRNYKRTTNSASYGAEVLQQAIKLVKEKGFSIRDASKTTGIPFTTVRQMLKIESGAGGYKNPGQVRDPLLH